MKIINRGLRAEISQDSRAFTLIETMVAISILAMMIVTVYAAFYGTVKIIRLGSVSHDTLQQGRLAIETIRRDLMCAFPPLDGKKVFRGINNPEGYHDHDYLDFIAASNMMADPGENRKESDICEVGYFISEEYPEKGLLVRRFDLTPDRKPFSGGKIEIVAENVVGINFQYHNGEEWVESWDPDPDEEDEEAVKADGFPAMVLVEIMVRDKNDMIHTISTTVMLALSDVEITQLEPEDEDGTTQTTETGQSEAPTR
jgi:type II secretion system protein J